MNSERISLELARRMALNAQLLDGGTPLPGGKEGVARTIENLGYVQIDTIAVVQRAHHHTLWTRRPDYDPELLHELHAVDRRVFEYWGHAASYLPISDYRFYLPRMRRADNPSGKWGKERLEKHRHLMGPVLERIREEGPLSSRDFAPPPGAKRGTWWEWKPAKVALELLFSRGDLMIAERRSFQRVYDLTERVLPTGVDTRPPDDGELGRFLVRRALAAHGVAREKEIHDHIHAAPKKVISHAIVELLDAGDVMRVTLDEDPETDYFVLPDALQASARLEPTPARVFLLSPFDNLIIQRDRTKCLFGFDYVLECYTPAAKRKFGYFTLPILWGENLVGRLDPKADRKAEVLLVRNVVFEPEFSAYDEFLPPFAAKLAKFARFNGCDTVRLEEVLPAGVRQNFESILGKIISAD